ncbi:MAG TPA: hypothetical protein VH593_07110 [Ktedonobacteraceae bacterium]
MAAKEQVEIYHKNSDGTVIVYDCGAGARCVDEKAAEELAELLTNGTDLKIIGELLKAHPEKYS